MYIYVYISPSLSLTLHLHLKEVEPCRTKTHKNHIFFYMFFSLFCCFLHQEESLEHYASPLNQKTRTYFLLAYKKRHDMC